MCWTMDLPATCVSSAYITPYIKENQKLIFFNAATYKLVIIKF